VSQPFNPSDTSFNGANSNGSLPGSANNGFNGMPVNGAPVNGVPVNESDGRGAPAPASLPAPAGLGGRELDRFAPAPPPAAYPRAPMGSDDDDETVDLSRYWRALKRRRGLVLKTFLSVLALGVVWTALQKPIYQSTAQILVDVPASGGGSGGGNELSQLLGGVSTSRSLGQQMVIIRSPGVQKGVFKRLKAPEQEEIKRFSRTDIAPEPGAEAINVQAQAHTAVAAAALAQAISDEYIDQSKQQARNQVGERTRQLLINLVQARRERDETSDKVRRFQQRYKTNDLPSETTALIAQVTQAQADARANDTQRRSDERRLQGVESQLRTVPNYTPGSIVPTPAVEALKSRLIELNIELVNKSREYTPASRTIRDLKAQVQALQNQLSTTKQQQFGALNINPQHQNLLQQKSDLENSILASQAKASALKDAVAQSQAERDRVPDLAFRLGVLKSDQQIAQSAFETLTQQYQTLHVQEIARTSNAHVITPADPDASPMIAPRRTFNIIASALLGLLLGAALALLFDRFDDRVRSTDEAVEAAHLPVLAHVPLVEGGGAALLLSGAGGASQNPALVESFRMLRANIAFAGLDEPPRVIAITSSRAGEGKSTSALNLATIMALSGKSVLLVDCDLRRPEVHALLGLPNEVGLTTVAAGMSSLDSAIQTTRVPGLRVLTSGPIPPNAPELFGSRGGRAALLAAGQKAEFVVLDCPPTLGLADAHLVSHLADATLLVVACESTNKREVARSGRSLAQAGGRLLGLVLNKMPVTRGENDDYFQLPSLQNGASGRDGALGRGGSSSGLVASTPDVSAGRATSAAGSSTGASQSELQ